MYSKVIQLTHTQKYIFLIFSLIGYYKIWNIVRWLYSTSLLLIYFMYSGMYVNPKLLRLTFDQQLRTWVVWPQCLNSPAGVYHL